MPASEMLCRPARRSHSTSRVNPRSSRQRVVSREVTVAQGGHAASKRDARNAFSDEELLRRYRDNGRQEDFAELYHRYSNRLGRCLTRYLGDASLAEDALQDSFLQLHRKRALYRDGCPARPWLYAVAIHRAVDTLRRARKLPMISLDGPPSDTGEDAGSLIDQLAGAAANPLEALQNRERQQWVRESMDRLPEPMRQVLALAYDRELSYAEIASVLGTPLGTVKSRLHAAIGRLREMAERCDKVASR